MNADNRRKLVEPFSVASSVLLSTRWITLSTPGPTKLWPKFIGPFKVLARIGEVSYRLELPVHLKIHNVFHVSMLRRFVAGKSPIPPAVPVDANIEYEIKKLLDFQVLKVGRGTRREFLVKWLDYGPEHNTWEPAIVIEKSAPLMVTKFLARQKGMSKAKDNSAKSVTRTVGATFSDVIVKSGPRKRKKT